MCTNINLSSYIYIIRRVIEMHFSVSRKMAAMLMYTHDA